MHGIPPNLDLLQYHGAVLTQLCIGEFQLQFIFTTPELILSVEGDWQLKNAQGEMIDRSLPNEQRESFKIHRLLGRAIKDHIVDAPVAIVLHFDNGWTLSIFDSSTEFESFSIQPGNLFI